MEAESRNTPLVWSTVKRKVRELLPYEFNPRQLTNEQHLQLTASLKRLGLIDIPAIDVDNKLVGGHQRVRVMIELGMADEVIDVRIPNRKLTESEFKEANIRLNKNLGEFSYDILANSFELDDLKAWGFSEAELGLGFDEPPAGDADAEPKEAKIHTCSACGFKFKD